MGYYTKFKRGLVCFVLPSYVINVIIDLRSTLENFFRNNIFGKLEVFTFNLEEFHFAHEVVVRQYIYYPLHYIMCEYTYNVHYIDFLMGYFTKLKHGLLCFI